MKKWVGYITSSTTTKYLWTGGEHYGDWLGLDAPSGSYKGSSDEDLIASAFYAHSTELVMKAGNVLGEDVSEYETLYKISLPLSRKPGRFTTRRPNVSSPPISTWQKTVRLQQISLQSSLQTPVCS